MGCTTVDFGWSLSGRAVTLLNERTVHVELEPVREEGIPCLQCGVCTASCALAETSQHFPRRTVALLQLGVKHACRRTEPWECHGCGDCNEQCPNMLGPARHLADLRRQAVREAVRPSWLTDRLDDWRGLAAAVAIAAGAVIGLAGFSGSLVVAGPVRFASFLPHPALVTAFGGLVGFALVVFGMAAGRAWRWYRPGATSPHVLLRAVLGVSGQALSHRKRTVCTDGWAPAQAHAAVFTSFLGLALLAAWAAGTVMLKGEYPFPLHHPVKIVGNVLALFMVAGSGSILLQRLRGNAVDRSRRPFDVFLPLALFVIALTGVALEVCRAVDARAWAYPLYVVHLAFVAVTLGLFPWTKLAHALHRLVALVSQEVSAFESSLDGAREQPPKRAGPQPPAGIRRNRVGEQFARLTSFGFAPPTMGSDHEAP